MTDEVTVKKIVITGPESTGKSTLCEQLAQHYNTLWCLEYARTYLLENGKDYTYDDLLNIAIGQLTLEDAYTEEVRGKEHEIGNWEAGIGEDEISKKEVETGNRQPATGNPKLLFIDTDMYVMKVWCEFVFGKCHQFILDNIIDRKYDLYLLCNTDLPWIEDELREYPEEATRKELYNIYKNLLINQQTPWVEISGNYEERLQQAIAAVERYVVRSV